MVFLILRCFRSSNDLIFIIVDLVGNLKLKNLNKNNNEVMVTHRDFSTNITNFRSNFKCLVN